MTTAENIALIGESKGQFRRMLARAHCESISVEVDGYEGHAATDFIFPDGSKLRVCAGHMEAFPEMSMFVVV